MKFNRSEKREEQDSPRTNGHRTRSRRRQYHNPVARPRDCPDLRTGLAQLEKAPRGRPDLQGVITLGSRTGGELAHEGFECGVVAARVRVGCT